MIMNTFQRFGRPKSRFQYINRQSFNDSQALGSKIAETPSNVMSMKTTSLRIKGLAIALAAFGAVAIFLIHAQPSTSRLGALSGTTNWVGYLVVGQTGTLDRIAPGPFPTTVRQVAIGLRSDGVVIWQEFGKTR
jgi:hypothetical protein